MARKNEPYIYKVLRRETPNPRQQAFFRAEAANIAYGGARGGGKSWAMRRKLVLLAMRYGEDAEAAAEADILHDITKKLSYDEQLILCDKYGIILDKDQLANEKLLHAITGAAFARDVFGVSDAVYDAIRWHTTGKPDMTLLEKIIYMADYVEPTRDFPGVEKLRALAHEDIDAAMALGLEMSLADIRSGGVAPHKDTVEAAEWYARH